MLEQTVIHAIEASPLNRGLRGADWLAQSGNVAFVEGSDVVLFDFESEGMYQIHVLLESRGSEARDCILRAIDRLKAERRVDIVFGMVPECRRDVAVMARMVGMRSIGKVPTIYGDCRFFVLTKVH